MAGAIASVTGFGIGSILTPLFSLQMETKIAITAVAIPHLSATLLRFWTLRGHVDRSVFRDFGIASAAGGLIGAVMHAVASSRLLTLVFGLLLVFAGLAELTRLSRRVRFGPRAARLAGATSGL